MPGDHEQWTARNGSSKTRWAILAAALTTYAASGDALAAGPEPDTEAAADARALAARRAERWTLAAGLTALFAGNGLGGQSTANPLLSLMVERRLTHRLWLLATVLGGYAATDQDVEVTGGLDGAVPLSGDTVHYGGALGARWVVTPDSPFRFSLLLTAGASHQRSDYESTDLEAVPAGTYQGRTTLIGAQAGVALDRELIDGLGVRLAATVARAGWSTSRSVTDAGSLGRSDSESEGYTAELTLSPSFELRFSF